MGAILALAVQAAPMPVSHFKRRFFSQYFRSGIDQAAGNGTVFCP